MKRIKKSLSVVLSVMLLLSGMLLMSSSVLAEENAANGGEDKTPDFVMESEYLQISAKELLDKAVFSYDETQFQRGPVLIAANEDGKGMYIGQFVNHSGKGDRFTFTVDFGTRQVDRLGFLYGGGGCTMELDLYKGDVLVGKQAASAYAYINGESYKNAPECIMTFDTPLTGVCTLTLVNAENNTAWPGTDYGYFVFYETSATAGGLRKQQTTAEKELEKQNKTWDDIEINAAGALTVTGKENVVGASVLLNIENGVHRKPGMFNSAGHDIAVNTAAEERYNGMFFIHAGAGDRFVFYMDWKDWTGEAMGFLQYGASDTETVFELYADGILLGTGRAKGGNGWEPVHYADATYDEIIFSQKVTGLVKMEIRIISSPASWPANNIGYFTFYAQPAEEAETAVETENGTDISAESAVETDAAIHSDTETADGTGCTSAVNEGMWAILLTVVVAVSGKKRKERL